MTESKLYGYPLLGRYGLGNMLFPWARCYLWCKDNNIPMVAPKWLQFRIGPYLRRERDKRNYQRLFHHHRYIGGLHRLMLLATAHIISESDALAMFKEGQKKGTVVVFRGMEGMFSPILGRSFEVKAELQRITRPEYLPKSSTPRPFVGVHVRMGDFRIPKSESELRAGADNTRIPISWYAEIIGDLRRELATEVQAQVFSDGSEEELSELLMLPNVSLCRGGAAITDLLKLAQASAVVASGSTFSMWASYLGQTPTIWHPGQRRQLLLDKGGSPSLEPEIDARGSLPEAFLSTVEANWKAHP